MLIYCIPNEQNLQAVGKDPYTPLTDKKVLMHKGREILIYSAEQPKQLDLTSMLVGRSIAFTGE